MSEAQQAGEMSATEALLDVHRQFVSSLDTSALVPDAEGASGLPGVNIEHDAAASEMEAIDGQAGHLVGSMTETDNPASLLGTDAPLFPPSVHVVGTDAGHLNDFATPTLATVAPAEVTSLPIPEVEALLAPPSEVQMSMELPYTSGRRLPHQAESTAATQDGIISGPPTATDIAETASSSSGGESPDIASFPLHTVADPLSKEYLVTLPFSSNRRHLYLEKLNRAKSAIGEYGLYFQSELTPDPKVSSVYQIDKLFAELINICDLPDTLERSSVEKMTQKELQKLCVETNAKFAFIYDLLMDLQDSGGKVLIIARSDELLCYLESLLIPEGFAFSRQGLDQMQHVQTDSVKVVLARQNQELVDTATDFDIVIGFDFEFKQSTIAREIASSDPSTLPYVFSLVIGHSIEHLDIHLTTKNPGMDLLYRKNGLAIMLWKTQPTIADPPGYWKPYAIAKQLASLVRQTGEALLWRPMEIPEHVVQIYLDPPSGEPNLSPEIVIADSNTKKRKLGEDGDEGVRKRRKVALEHLPLVDISRTEAIEPFVRILGPDILDEDPLVFAEQITIPTALLRSVEWKMENLQQSVDEKNGHIRDLREQVAALEMQNNDYKNSINEKFVRFRESIEERGKFEYERNNAMEETEKLQKASAISKEEIERLKAKVAQLETISKECSELVASGDDGEKRQPLPTALEIELEEARAEIAKQKKNTESAEKGLEYTRKAYQDASKAARELGLQNRVLQAKVEDLTTVADESFRRVHEINGQKRILDLESLLDDREHRLTEHKTQLDRVNKELAALKNGRRETRHASVPRSPRMGMMSPRPGGGRSGIGGSASRGTSPAPLLESATLQTAGLPYNGNNRWVHLRDQY